MRPKTRRSVKPTVAGLESRLLTASAARFAPAFVSIAPAPLRGPMSGRYVTLGQTVQFGGLAEIEGLGRFFANGTIELGEYGPMYGKLTLTSGRGTINLQLTRFQPYGEQSIVGQYRILNGTGDYLRLRGVGGISLTGSPISETHGTFEGELFTPSPVLT